MTRPTREETLMEVAELFAQRSTCSRAHVGVVIAREGRILTTGYNGAPAGMSHCDHETFPNIQGCKTAVHAEANAIAYAARYGIGLEGAELFSTYMPCLPCAQIIVNAGISKIYVKHLYRDKAGAQLLEAAKIEVVVI